MAPKKINIQPGDKFSRLTVISEAEKRGRERYFLCICDCGSKRVVSLSHLRTGNTKSCGCYRTDVLKQVSYIHGYSRTRLYRIWISMKARCFDVNATGYCYWGGRGITVCKEWLEFMPFYEWAMANGYSDDLTIERIDNDGNYEPANCTWILRGKQAKNKRHVLRKRKAIYLSLNGRTLSLKQWASCLGIRYNTLYNRLFVCDWPLKKALAQANSIKGNDYDA